MIAREVVIVNTDCANLASVISAFARLGLQTRVSDSVQLVQDAPLVVLPGVGSFGIAMKRLRAAGLDQALTQRVQTGRPLLAICLGMQLLCEASEESPGETGFGLIPGTLRRFGPTTRVPQMGWNRITPAPDASLLQPAAMYFANSYRLENAPAGWNVASSDHGGTFVAALERGPLLACQFHPELSGQAGLALIGRWLALSQAMEGVTC